jgi:hypothetical protein
MKVWILVNSCDDILNAQPFNCKEALEQYLENDLDWLDHDYVVTLMHGDPIHLESGSLQVIETNMRYTSR